MDERAPSGDEGLDLILGGGLPMNGINLIIGLPGSGKTLLCQQFMFARATAERRSRQAATDVDAWRARKQRRDSSKISWRIFEPDPPPLGRRSTGSSRRTRALPPQQAGQPGGRNE